MSLFLQLCQTRFDLLTLLVQQLGFDGGTESLHPRQHRQQRQFDLAEHLGEARLGRELAPQRLMQTQGDVGIFRRVRSRLLQFNLVEGELLDPLPAISSNEMVSAFRYLRASESMSWRLAVELST